MCMPVPGGGNIVKYSPENGCSITQLLDRSKQLKVCQLIATLWYSSFENGCCSVTQFSENSHEFHNRNTGSGRPREGRSGRIRGWSLNTLVVLQGFYCNG